MQEPERPADEAARLQALARYDILDTPAEAEFDDLTFVATLICGTPIGLVTLLDSGRQWFKSKIGIDVAETARNVSFCGHAILDDAVFEIPDALEDARFADNPLVTDTPHVRFYAGAPLITSDGFRLGTLCVIDHVARRLTEGQRDALAALSRQVVRQMEARALARQLARQSRFQTAVLNSPDIAMITTTIEGVIIGFNHAAQDLLGYAAHEMIGIRTLDACYEPLLLAGRAAAMLTQTGEALASGFALLIREDRERLIGSGDWLYRRQDGTQVPVRISITPILAEKGEIVGYLSSARDITEQQAAAIALQNSQQLLQTLIETLPIAVYTKRLRKEDAASGGEMLIWNRAAEEMTGVPAASVIGRTDRDAFSSDLAAMHAEHDRVLLDTKAPLIVPDYSLHRADGSVRLLRLTSVPLLDAAGEVEYTMGIAEDITTLKATENELRHMARSDSLTSLPNRVQFYETLEAAQLRGKRRKSAIAVLFIDIDHFKKINDTLGHANGDLVLQEFATRLTQAVRMTDTVARLAGDEFVIVLEGLSALREAEVVAEKILTLVAKPWLIGDENLVVTTSIGVAFDDSHMQTGAALIAHADELLYAAKEAGRNTYHARVS